MNRKRKMANSLLGHQSSLILSIIVADPNRSSKMLPMNGEKVKILFTIVYG